MHAYGLCVFVFFFKIYFTYFREKGCGGESKKGREKHKQTPCCALSPTHGSISQPWDHILSWSQESFTPPTASSIVLFLKKRPGYQVLVTFTALKKKHDSRWPANWQVNKASSPLFLNNMHWGHPSWQHSGSNCGSCDRCCCASGNSHKSPWSVGVWQAQMPNTILVSLLSNASRDVSNPRMYQNNDLPQAPFQRVPLIDSRSYFPALKFKAVTLPFGSKTDQSLLNRLCKMMKQAWKEDTSSTCFVCLGDLRDYQATSHFNTLILKKDQMFVWSRAGGTVRKARDQFSLVKLTQDVFPGACQPTIKHPESTGQHQCGWSWYPFPKRHPIFVQPFLNHKWFEFSLIV